jgi:hypothetical protein
MKITEVLEDFFDANGLDAEIQTSSRIPKEMRSDIPKRFNPESIFVVTKEEEPIFWVAYASNMYVMKQTNQSKDTTRLMQLLAAKMKEAGIKQKRTPKVAEKPEDKDIEMS